MNNKTADQNNLFAVPKELNFSLSCPIKEFDPEIIVKFRRLSHMLGITWILQSLLIFLGAALGVFANYVMQIISVLKNEPNFVLKSIGLTSDSLMQLIGWCSLLAGLWLVAGLATYFKQILGIYLGLLTTYLWLIGSILYVNYCGLAIALLNLVEAHRLLYWGREIQSAGIPLNDKPFLNSAPESIH